MFGLKLYLDYLSIHFQQLEKLPEDQYFLPVIFSPIIGLLALFLLGRIAALLITTYGPSRELISLTLSTALIGILLWQLLLLYFLLSYLVALWRK